MARPYTLESWDALNDQFQDAQARIIELERALAEEQQRSQWQSISTAPKDGTLLLGWWQPGLRGKGLPFILTWARHLDGTPDGNMCWMDFTCACPRESLYWQSIPTPPERSVRDVELS